MIECGTTWPFTHERNSVTDWIRVGETNAVMSLRVRQKMHLSPLQVSTASNSTVLYVWGSLQDLFYLSLYKLELAVQHLAKSEVFLAVGRFPKVLFCAHILKVVWGHLKTKGNCNTFLLLQQYHYLILLKTTAYSSIGLQYSEIYSCIYEKCPKIKEKIFQDL